MATTTSLILYRGQGTGHVTGLRLLPRIGLLSPSPLPVAPVNYSPWPQGGIKGIHSALGTRRRAKLAKALHEAIEREEPEKKKPKRKPRKKPVEIQQPEPLQPAAAEARPIEEPPVDRETPPPTPIEETEYVPRATRSTSGIGHLRGRRRRAIQGTLDASAGGDGRVLRWRQKPKAGRLEPEGIQNPSLETLLTYLTAA